MPPQKGWEAGGKGFSTEDPLSKVEGLESNWESTGTLLPLVRVSLLRREQSRLIRRNSNRGSLRCTIMKDMAKCMCLETSTCHYIPQCSIMKDTAKCICLGTWDTCWNGNNHITPIIEVLWSKHWSSNEMSLGGEIGQCSLSSIQHLPKWWRHDESKSVCQLQPIGVKPLSNPTGRWSR